MEWTETEASSEAQEEKKDIVLALNKVRKPPFYLILYSYQPRFGD
jgi:hypothetical protein